MRWVIPHGGGAVPYHWGRFKGMGEENAGWHTLDEMMANVWFDTCVYHQPGNRPAARGGPDRERAVRLGDGRRGEGRRP